MLAAVRIPSERPSKPSPSDEVRYLVEAGRVVEARQRVAERLAAGETDMEHWAKLLREPRTAAVAIPPSSDFGPDYRWLAEHRATFHHRWVALRNGALLDADETLAALIQRLTTRGDIDGAFVVQVD